MTLLELLPVERQEAILRLALSFTSRSIAITAPLPLSERSPSINVADVAAWHVLRQRVRDTLDLEKKSFGSLAAETGLSRSSLEKCLSPAGPAAGRVIAEE